MSYDRSITSEIVMYKFMNNSRTKSSDHSFFVSSFREDQETIEV